MSTIDQCPSTLGKLNGASVDTPAAGSPAAGSPAAGSVPAATQAAAGLPVATGERYWRSLDELAGTPEFRDWAEREFPAGASELSRATSDGGETRRTFLKLMAASFALAGASTIPGCRRPDHAIVAYSANEPEHTIPGKALFFATSVPVAGGGAEGLLIETQSGRPTKVEGNPLHPANRGKSTAFSQSEILRLYDPDRPSQPSYFNSVRGERLDATWDDFTLTEPGLLGLRARHDGEAGDAGDGGDAGAGLAFVVDRRSSPTLLDMQRRVMAKFPRATWVWWDPIDERRSELDGTTLVLQTPSRVYRDFSKARCVVSLDADFVDSGPDQLTNARAFASTRRVLRANEEMSRLYMLESKPSGTGSMADHRFPASPTETTRFSIALAQELMARTGMSNALSEVMAGVVAAVGDDEPAAGIPVDAIADDLLARAEQTPGSAFIVAGPSQPAIVHALTVVMNQILGANGASVNYTAEDRELWEAPGERLASLVESMNAGEISTLVCVNANPAYDAPAGIGFAEAMGNVANTVALDSHVTETMMASSWALNGTHAFEAWGDTEAWDGTISPVQPMIAPLFDPAKSDVEFLAMLAGENSPDAYDIVQQVWSRRMGLAQDNPSFKTQFRRALHDGVLAGSGRRMRNNPRVSVPDRLMPAMRLPLIDRAREAVAMLNAAGSGGGSGDAPLELVFATGRVGDGRFANVGWLQELPQVGTQAVWENPAVVSPKTAERLRLLPVGQRKGEGDLSNAYTSRQIPRAREATLKVGDRTVDVPVWILPGMPDGVVHIALGYGRTEVGRVGAGVGTDAFTVRDGGARFAVTRSEGGATLTPTGSTVPLASTQNHWSMEGRTSIVRAIDKKYFDKHAAKLEKEAKVKKDKIYGAALPESDVSLNVAEQLGELAHTPANVSLYVNPQNASRAEPVPNSGADFSKGPQWGMTIDLSTCSGCGVCTVACQSENNIPIVGRAEVAKGREMSWIRVDRYFAGGDANQPDEMVHQPVACVHCENAPCEVVCPVNATVHGDEGTNNMAYNRCIGTRYCANNCPYKVRRFNFFEYGQVKYNGSFIGSDVLKSFTGDEEINQQQFNKNFIPPRLREKLDEISQMKMNPDVTVRSRGVMEKCTYCIQRVNEARQEVKVRDIWKTGQATDLVASQAGTYEAPIPDGFFEVACQQACPTDSIVFGDILNPESRVSAMRANQRSYALLGYLNTRPRTSHMIRVRNPNPAIRVYDEKDPLDHGSHGGSHGGDHGGDHSEESHSEDAAGMHEGEDHSSAFFDRRRGGEHGYLASLRVMN
ncbi:MAG: TAT-variant-translocated molybdopterin oxidoreductase [Planctomycetota bacterium]